MCKIYLNGVGYVEVSLINMPKTHTSYRRLVELIINE